MGLLACHLTGLPVECPAAPRYGRAAGDTLKKLTTQQFAVGGLLVAALVVLALAGFAWDFARGAVAAADYVNHTHKVKALISDLEANLYRAEAGQRAYLATRNTGFRNERDLALQALDGGLADMARFIADNPEQ